MFQFGTSLVSHNRGVKLKAIVRWSDGVALRYNETRILFDPIESDPVVPDLFITHAHYDHYKGFQFPIQTKYSTKETRELYEIDSGRKTGNWQQVRLGRRLKLGEVEVEAHDAGHILGAVQYEIITPEGSIVYTSHINFVDTLLTHAAEVAPCELLIIETTLASPSRVLAPRESVVAQIVKWALQCVKERRIPAFMTDRIGNAQELVRIFNNWTELPVVVHPKIARVNKVYENGGVALHYTDSSTPQSQSLVENAECIVVVPRGFDATRFGDFRIANVSCWSSKDEDEVGKSFQLSDQANLNQLLRFVQEARPKNVLTFRGASKVFAQMVNRKLGITANELAGNITRPKLPQPKLDEGRIVKCQDILLNSMDILDFTYEKEDLLNLGMRQGFKGSEIEEALERFIKSGGLEYSQLVDGYRLSFSRNSKQTERN
jgi:putative mRNA 3-end processing factor